MAFQRIVEVFPPALSISDKAPFDLAEKVTEFVKGVRGIRTLCDLALVANVKNPSYVKLSTIFAASLLQERIGLSAAPSIVARDENRLQLASSVLTAMELELKAMLLVWGDRYPIQVGATNVRDHHSLAEIIRQAAGLRRRVGSSTRILAPVDLRLLRRESGVRVARSRIRAGAELLLAQPPTTDAGATLQEHLALLESTGLMDRVMLNVFPFRDTRDVSHCEEYFGWKLPRSLHRTAAKGGDALLEEAREVHKGIKAAGLPGVYVATRGRPAVARDILG